MKIDRATKTALFFVFSFVLGLFFFAFQVSAFDQPSFPSCLNPQGQVIAQHNDGAHGVPGMNQTFTGSDSVFALSSSTVLQCLCPNNGQGIQTNWMKATELSQSEISVLENQGWVYVANGSVWGLDPDPYIVQNMNFSCPTSSNGSSALLAANTSSGNNNNQSNGSNSPSNNNSSNNSSNQNSGNSSSVLGSSTQQVLGLATTGNIVLLYIFLIAGTFFVGMGMLLRK